MGRQSPSWPITSLPTRAVVAVPTPTAIRLIVSPSPPCFGQAGERSDSDPFFLPVMEKGRPFPECSAPYVGFGCEDGGSSYSFNGPTGKEGGFSSAADPELKRKKRIAAYNSFVTENKLKSSVRSSVKWIKGKFADVRYG